MSMDNHLSTNVIAVFLASDHERQVFMREYAARRGFCVVGFLALLENAIGAGIKHAINLCNQGDTKTIVIDELKTFSLPSKELLEALVQLRSAQIRLVFAHEDLILDEMLLNAFEKIFTQSRGVDAQLRSLQIKKSLHLKKRKGTVLGGRKFGEDTGENYVIKQIIKLRDEGKSLQVICDLLLENGIKTAQGKMWHPTTVKRILERISRDRCS